MKTAEYTSEEREAYRRHKLQFAYDRAELARRIVRDAYKKQYPHAKRPCRDGIVSCGNPIDFGEIEIYLDDRGHEYHNHKSCKSWACPVCAPKRAYSRADEIADALLAAHERGYTCFFVTFTVPHRKAHSSRYVIDKLNACYNRFLQLRAIREVKKKYGYVGAIKCLDYTLTDNGTHAHLHTLFFFDTAAEWLELMQELARTFLKSYVGVVKRETGKELNQHKGFNIELIDLGADDAQGARRAARYAAKAISVYCADGDKEKSSKTPFDLLKSGSTDDDAALFLDFYRGQKGRRHIVFSRGLRAVLGIEKHEDERRPAVAVANITYEHAYRLKDEGYRQKFEKLAVDSIDAALTWLHDETIAQQQLFYYSNFSVDSGVHDFAPLFNTPPVRYDEDIAAFAVEDERSEAIERRQRARVAFLPDLLEEWDNQRRAREAIARRSLTRERAHRAWRTNRNSAFWNERRPRPVSGLGAALAKLPPPVIPDISKIEDDDDLNEFWF